ncbi:M10 family metallopeptidase [Gloeocapsopsis sp. IPPAS B-1203]|uniref:M10 family metallopeptidase n=1 Tax=Gloeocapsopsis sp. IPPAS B-1203 TaxID=2049454 RepID=UPI000C19E9AE|nr:M10 family metallopeptidase [Gloeocapsopsis sp. IPPAS B-1203]PIG91423.1 hypothetical protein CSQ79_20950 [Gloeocapsopsis sp. IPPAS B-1203]
MQLNIDETLQQALEKSLRILTAFANTEDFLDKLTVSFGNSLELQAAKLLAQDWVKGDFSKLPKIEIRPTSEINEPHGTFNSTNNTIDVSRDYLSQNIDNPTVITGVLLEKIGQYISSRVNNDTEVFGDEGAIFSVLMQGAILTKEQIQLLRIENNSALALVNSQSTETEQLTTNLNNTNPTCGCTLCNLNRSTLTKQLSYGFDDSTSALGTPLNSTGSSDSIVLDSTVSSAGIPAAATPTSNGVVSIVSFSGLNNIDSLISGQKWGGATGTGANLTYSFGEFGISYYAFSVYPQPGAQPWNGFTPFTATQKNATRKALAAWSEMANLQFTEVIDSATVAGDLRFARSSQLASGATTAEAYTPAASPTAGDVWFSNNSVYNTETEGTYGYATFMHEIGHALGLKHPHDSGTGGIANSNIDTTAYSVMSYRSYINAPLTGYTQNFYSTSPMLNDIATIQYLYGTNMSTRSGNTVYSWTPGQQIFEAIWDAGGIDTIDWSNQFSNANINLNAGTWSELGPTYWNGQAAESRTLAIAYNVTIENAVGGSGNDTLTGNSASNLIESRNGNDNISGGLGNDTLDGGGGIDTMNGGQGDDVYLVDHASDSAIENPGEGTDTYRSSASSFQMNPNVENLVMLSGAINATGTSIANQITGNSANNTLDGGGGADTLIGGLGNDIYIVDNASDFAMENVGEGTDTYHSTATSFVMDANVENIVMFSGAVNAYGTSTNNTMTGNSASNTLDGGGGNDILYGKLGNDTLISGTGNDTLVGDVGADVLTGGSGKDVFYFQSRSQGIDRITDFSVIDDTIQVSRAGFGGGLVAGRVISTAQFIIGSSAGDSSDRFIYNRNTGGFFFDADGRGGSSQTQIATLSSNLGLTNADIFVVA